MAEQLHVAAKRLPHCRVEIKVKTTGEMIAKARQEAVREVGKEVVLPGFRKGRAPEEMILKKFAGDVEKRFGKCLADLAFNEAQKIENIAVLNGNAPVTFHMDQPDGSELTFTFETEPEIPSVSMDGFSPKETEKREVSEKEIEEAIRQMRFFFAEWSPVERGIEEGDYAIINLDTVEDTQIHQVFNHVRFEVSKARMAEWMQKLMLGAKVGDVLEGMSEPDANASDAEKAEFKPKKARVTIIKVEKALLPEADDEFAKKVGAKDAGDMRESVLKLLQKQLDDKAKDGLREQVNAYLLEQYTFELPASLIETEKKHRMGQMLHDPKFKASWDKMSQEERVKIVKDMENEANEALRLFYLSRQVVREAKIPVTHHEVQQEAVQIYQNAGKQVSLDQLPKEVLALALSRILLTKAQDFVIQSKKA